MEMNTDMDENFSSIVESCDSCNMSCDPWNVRQYEVLYEGSKIHDQNRITLCYVCSKVAKYFQQLINNIQGKSVMKPDVQKSQKPIINLTTLNLGTIELSETNNCDVVSSYSILSAKNGKILTKCNINVKIEDCSYELEILPNEVIPTPCDEDLDSTSIKKAYSSDEDTIPLKDLINNDVDINEEARKKNGDSNNSSTTHTVLDVNKEENSNKDNKIIIPMVQLTKEEYWQEKIDRSKTERYLNSQFKCADCVLSFINKIDYLKHMEKHSEGAGWYECELCKQRWYTNGKLQDHLKTHTIRYKCIHCNLLRKQSETIREHLYSVHKIGTPPKFECDKCYMVYYKKPNLRAHKKAKHTPRNKVPCTYCQKIYSTLETLRRHMILKHPDEVGAVKQEKTHVCQECGAAFTTAVGLKKHQRTHSDRRDYYCVECDKSYKSEGALRTHLKTTAAHCINSDLPLVCTQCEKRFSSRRDLVRHTNTIHLNIKAYQCDQCSKGYSSVWSLNTHKKFVHEGLKRPLKTKKFQCKFCDKEFSEIRILKTHTRTHTGERPYQCDKCQATFAQSSTLSTHNKLVHLRLKRNLKKK